VDVARIADLRRAVDRTRSIPLVAAAAIQPAIRARLDEYVSNYVRVYGSIARVSGCPTIVDSSKHASLAFCLRRQSGLDLRVIHVVRDSRAVAYSWTRQVNRPDSAGPSYMTTYSPAVAAGQWNVQNRALQLLARTGTPTLRIRYEDLIAAPRQTIARIAAFAGLPAGRRQLRFLGRDDDGRWAELGAAHTASGNPMRFRTGRIAIRGDERWRSAMPAGQRRAVTALTLPLLAQYGYAGRAA
jgi:hypothetical protein